MEREHKMKRYLPALGLNLLLAACAPDVLVQQDPASTLPGPASYAWTEPDNVDGTVPGGNDPRVHNDIVHAALHQAISQGLAKRGYQTSSSPAWLVSYSIGLQKTLRVVDEPLTTAPQMVCFAYHGCFMEDFNSVYVTRSYPVNQNTLVIDLSDAKTHKLAWRGILSQDINLHRDLKPERLQEAVDAVLARLPGPATTPNTYTHG